MPELEVTATVDFDHIERQLLQAVEDPGFGRIASNALLAIRALRRGSSDRVKGPNPAILADLRELAARTHTIMRDDELVAELEAIITRHEPELRRMARADRAWSLFQRWSMKVAPDGGFWHRWRASNTARIGELRPTPVEAVEAFAAVLAAKEGGNAD